MGQINDCKFNAMGGGGTPPEHAVVFHAATYDPDTYELQQESVGVGGETCTHTSTIYAPDYLGVYHAFGANEPVWEGMRVVTNRFLNSEDFTQWGTLNAAPTITPAAATDPNGFSASLIVPPNGEQYSGLNQTAMQATHMSFIVKTTGVSSVDIGSASWNTWGACTFNFTTKEFSGSGLGIFSNYGYSDLGDGWLRLFVVAKENVPNQSLYVRANDASNDGLQGFYLSSAQLDFADLNSLYNSEHLITTSTPVTKHLSTTNGNTVTDNVVTEAVGALLDPLPMLVYQPAATNEFLYSRDFSSTGWGTVHSAQEVQDQVGIDGAANTAWTVTDLSGVASEFIQENSTGGALGVGEYRTSVTYIKKDSDETRFPLITARVAGGVTPSGIGITLNTATGATHAEIIQGSLYDYEVESVGAFWKVILQAEGGTSGTAIYYNQIYPAYSSTLTGGQDVAATGSIVVDNQEVHTDKTIAEVRGLSPIFTTTAAVSTDEIINTWAAANHSDAGDSYEADYKLSGEDQVLLSMGGTAVLEVKDGGIGGEICTDPGFDDAGQWEGNSDAVVASSVCTFTAVPNNASIRHFPAGFTFEAGDIFELSLEIKEITLGAFQLRLQNGGTQVGLSTDIFELGVHKFIITATGVGDGISVTAIGTTTGVIDNISIKDIGKVISLTDGTNSCSTPVVSAEPHIIATYNRVLGAELIANGDFSNGTTGWTAYSSGSVIDATGEQINCETTFEDRGFYQQIPGLIRDKEYIMRVDVLTATTDNLRISLGSGIGNLTSGFIDITTPGHYEYTFTPIGDGDLFLSLSHGTTGDTSIDNVSFKEESAAESNMQLDVDGVKSAEVHYDGTLGSGDLSTQATQRDLIRRGS